MGVGSRGARAQWPVNKHRNRLYMMGGAKRSEHDLEQIMNLKITGLKVDATGEGSRGGHIIGHTSSGKPIYGAGHSNYTEKSKPAKFNVPISRARAVAGGAKGSHADFKRKHEGWASKDHHEAAEVHKKASEKAGKNWGKLRDKAHMERFGEKPHFGDYKVSGVGRSEYAEHHKDKLRALSKLETAHGDASLAHKKVATGGR